MIKALLVGLWCTFLLAIGNFAFEHFFGSHNWERAIELSWFQFGAIVVFVAMLTMRKMLNTER